MARRQTTFSRGPNPNPNPNSTPNHTPTPNSNLTLTRQRTSSIGWAAWKRSCSPTRLRRKVHPTARPPAAAPRWHAMLHPRKYPVNETVTGDAHCGILESATTLRGPSAQMTEHAYSGTSCGSLTLEVGKSPTATTLHGELSCPCSSGRRFSSSIRRRAVAGP